MLLLLVLLLVAAVVASAYLRWRQVRVYWRKKNVPHLSPHPILGSMTFFLKQNPALWMRKLYDSFKSPYVGIWIFWRPALVVNSREIARNILVKDSAIFRNRFATSGSTDPLGKLNIFTLKDPHWSSIRRPLTSIFTSAKLRGLQTLVTAKAKELVQRIEMERQKSKLVDTRMLMTDYTTDIIGTASFGVVCDATLTGESPVRTITKELMKFNLYRGICWTSAFFFPELVDVFRFKIFPTHTTDYLRKIFRNVVNQRGGYDKKITEPRDLLDVLLKMKQESNGEIEITEDLMLAQAAVFLQGGFDTSATTISFCIYELAFYPEAQEKLYEELKEAEAKYGDGLLDAQILSQLTYLNCVINEGLRKYPIMGWLDRIATADYKVDDHLTIPAGTPVYVNANGMHYDPDYFPEPDKFEPDRFLPEREKDIKAFSYMPFGEGPRKCIGQRFGQSSVRHALAAVLLKYEVRVIPGSPKPSEVEIDKNCLFLAPGEILYVEFVPRN